MYVDKEIMDKFNEYQMFLEKTYKEYENKLKVDYDAGTIEIEGKTYTLEKLEQIINVLKGTDEKKNMIDRNTYLDDHNQYYTIVDYRYYYITKMVKEKFSIYDIARYFQVSPKNIRESIKQIPELNEIPISKRNVHDIFFNTFILFRDNYIQNRLKCIDNPIDAGQKIGFYKIPQDKNITEKIMMLLTQNNYINMDKEVIDSMLSLSFSEAIKYNKKYFDLLCHPHSEHNWNKLREVYSTIKNNEKIIELKTYKFKHSEIAEYLNIPEKQVNTVINTLNCKCNGISISENIFIHKTSSDIYSMQIATKMIKAGEEIKNISIISGLYSNYISSLRRNLKKAGEITDDFSNSKKAKMRQLQVINLYVYTTKSQNQIAKELGITRKTVISDIKKYTNDYPEINELIHIKKILMAKSSRAEKIIFEILKPYGFIHGKTGTMQQYGLGKLEIDIFHPILKIGIEYDGFLMNKNGQNYGHCIDNDKRKDNICKENNIALIRIREPQIPVYKSEFIKFFYTKSLSGDIYNNNFLKCINDLISYLNETYQLNIDKIESITPYEEKVNKQFQKEIQIQKDFEIQITKGKTFVDNKEENNDLSEEYNMVQYSYENDNNDYEYI